MDAPAPEIVVGVDGAPASLQALRWALEQGRVTGGSVTALHAWHVPLGAGGYPLTYTQDWPTVAGRVLDAATSTVTASATSTVTADGLLRQLVEGHPAAVLLAASEHCDLLVLGSRGHGGLPGLALGSVTQHLVGRARCPVVVVRASGR